MCGCIPSSASGNKALRALCTQVLMYSIMRERIEPHIMQYAMVGQ